MGRIRHIEDVTQADAALEVVAPDLPDLFATAARALAGLAGDPASVGRSIGRTLELSAPDPAALLYDWLAELIVLKDSERLVLPEARVRITGAGPCRLRAEARGGSLDDPGLVPRADAKAVTLHRFALEEIPGGWRARFVIDL